MEIPINLFTAVIASIVIGFFQEDIEKVVALAVLMPIVASMGGNAGMQTLAVTVRTLATNDLTRNNFTQNIFKEFIDIKKYDLSTDVVVDAGAAGIATADVDLDPLAISIGYGWRF